MRKIILTLILTFVAVAGNAACIRCDQWTGYWCFMSIYGTKANCDSPSGAGCFTWGSCNPGADCGEDFCVENVAAVRFNESMKLAAVSVTVPLRDSKRRS